MSRRPEFRGASLASALGAPKDLRALAPVDWPGLVKRRPSSSWMLVPDAESEVGRLAASKLVVPSWLRAAGIVEVSLDCGLLSDHTSHARSQALRRARKLSLTTTTSNPSVLSGILERIACSSGSISCDANYEPTPISLVNPMSAILIKRFDEWHHLISEPIGESRSAIKILGFVP